MGRMAAVAWSLVAVVGLALPGAGCSRTMRMEYTKPTFLDATRGPVSVEVTDARADAEGGTEVLLVGQVRSGAGIPYGVWAKEGRQPPVVLREVLEDSLKAAGYAVADGGAAPTLHATLKRMWCDGYLHYEVSLLAPLELRGGAAPWTGMIESRGGVTLMWGPAELNKGFKRMLDDAIVKLVQQFQGAEFQAAVGSSR